MIDRDQPDDDWDRWLRRVTRELPPLIRNSAVNLTICPGDEPDAKIAVELGYTLLMDKPLILIRMAGRAIPTRLARAADVIIDWSDEAGVMQQRISDAMDVALAGERS